MYTAFISQNGNIVVVSNKFVFTPGQVPTKPIISYCRKGDDEYEAFLSHCKENGWM